MSLPPPTLGVILAGGLARRMGGRDKSLLRLGERTLLDEVAGRLSPQCDGLILNANGDPSRFGSLGLPVVPDTFPDHPGPLAGILAALEWAAVHRTGIEWLVSAPADTPFIPVDLVLRLHEARREAGRPLACAASAGQAHFAVALWPVRLRHDLRRALEEGGRSMGQWLQRHGCAEAAWPAEPRDPFFNVNTPDDLARARNLAQGERMP